MNRTSEVMDLRPDTGTGNGLDFTPPAQEDADLIRYHLAAQRAERNRIESRIKDPTFARFPRL